MIIKSKACEARMIYSKSECETQNLLPKYNTLIYSITAVFTFHVYLLIPTNATLIFLNAIVIEKNKHILAN